MPKVSRNINLTRCASLINMLKSTKIRVLSLRGSSATAAISTAEFKFSNLWNSSTTAF